MRQRHKARATPKSIFTDGGQSASLGKGHRGKARAIPKSIFTDGGYRGRDRDAFKARAIPKSIFTDGGYRGRDRDRGKIPARIERTVTDGGQLASLGKGDRGKACAIPKSTITDDGDGNVTNLYRNGDLSSGAGIAGDRHALIGGDP